MADSFLERTSVTAFNWPILELHFSRGRVAFERRYKTFPGIGEFSSCISLKIREITAAVRPPGVWAMNDAVSFFCQPIHNESLSSLTEFERASKSGTFSAKGPFK